ncbi:MAG: tRNA 2-selenouridine(34) synthase MnmH [Bacteroidales bacterium]|nr:tRNA 2-selenouridine(34) synthase MnmH [Bacteroidales bacterium]
MPKEVNIEEFLELSKQFPIIDVRSPGEYEHAHIPGALSLPLFLNDERAEVGTIYKQRGRVKAVQRGLEIVGPKLAKFTKFALDLHSEELLIHCWRGGMRSSSMAWLLENVGIKSTLLIGGYKSYRSYILSCFDTPLKIILLGGYTGSGKTDLLKILKDSGQQVLDLEGIAEHKGSAFGAIGQPDQPSNEYFENLLYSQIKKLDRESVVWIEDESRNIGKVFIPEPLWKQMRVSPLVKVEASFETRVERLMRDYGCYPVDKLCASIKKIEKRLGYDKCKLALDACERGDLKSAAEISLLYYDKAYGNQLETRFREKLNQLLSINFDGSNSTVCLQKLKDAAKELIF